MRRGKLHFLFGAALLAAPLFCLLCIVALEYKIVNIFWLFSEPKTFFILILFYPIVEELIFRGFIQESLGRKTEQFKSIYVFSVANILTSVLFVLIHTLHHPLLWAALTFVPSLIFGYFKERYTSVLPSIALHMFYNFTYFSLLAGS